MDLLYLLYILSGTTVSIYHFNVVLFIFHIFAIAKRTFVLYNNTKGGEHKFG